jgi:hypothetical protein
VPVVARFRDLADAEVASASLEAAEITNWLADTWTIGVSWSYSTALGGIRLHVREADVAEASDVLQTTAVTEWPSDLPSGSEDERCPDCAAFALELDSGPRKTLAVMTGLGVPVWFWRSRLRCRGCGWSRKVPLRFRPELVIAWCLIGIGVGVVIVVIDTVLAFAVYGRRA